SSGNYEDLGWFNKHVLPPFEKVITWAVDHRGLALLGYFGFLGLTVLLLIFGTKVNLFPAEQTEIYIARLESPKGTRVEETDKINQEVLKQIQDVLKNKAPHLVAVAGESAIDNSDPKAESGSNVSMIRIFVDKKTQDSVSTKEVLDQLRTIENKKLNRLSFEALINGPPVGDPVTVTFRSNDGEQLAQVAEHIKKFIAQKNGIFDAKVDDVYGDDEVNIKFDYDRVARLGLNLASIGNTVRTAIAGLKVGDVNLNNREVDYFLRFDDQDKSNTQNLADLQIPDNQGNLIPLANIATFDQTKGRPQIKRYDYRRAKTVTANLDDSIITSIQANQLIAEEFSKIQDQYKEVNMVFGGEAEKTNESVASLFGALILSLIGIFALLVLIFKSFLNPLIILTTVPLGLVGVALAFTIHDKPLSFMALIGVIGLGGIIVNSGIILISFIDQMRAETQMSLRDILIKSSCLRLKSVLVTSLTTISGLVPTAYGIGGSDYFIIPMALALAWGLSTGTLLTLIWVPPAYGLVEDALSFFRRKFKKPNNLNQEKDIRALSESTVH
ncbi:MAG: efflux RND transporter permease subunit, partial [Bdellovibrionales bacterium]